MGRHEHERDRRMPRQCRDGMLRLVLCLALAVVIGSTACSQQRALEERRGREADESVASTFEVVEPSADDDTAVASDRLADLLRAGSVSSVRVIGDSITAGYLLEGFDAPSDTGVVAYAGGEGTYYETPTYVPCWANSFRALAAQRGVGTFVNAAVSGFRMQYLAEDPAAWLADGADVIVVMLGTNDAAKESVDDFHSFAEEALLAAEARSTHLVVVCPPRNERTDTMNLYGMEQVEQVLSELCAAHGWEYVSLLDVLQVGTDDYFPDQVHPTEQGSAKLWEAFGERLGLM